jgi:hypothetical protein
MFVPTKRIMKEYHTLLLKMGLDAPIEVTINANLTHLVDVEVLYIGFVMCASTIGNSAQPYQVQ